MHKKALFLMVVLLLMLTLTGCVPGDGKITSEDPAGFFWGVWHGWIAPVSLIIGFFDRDIRVYEVINTGWWYDLGFCMAVIAGFGGFRLSRKINEKSKDKRKS